MDNGTMSEWQAGPELDVAVARWAFDLHAEVWGGRAYVRGRSGMPHDRGAPLDDRVLDPYSSDITAAWKVFEAVGEDWLVAREWAGPTSQEREWFVYKRADHGSRELLVVASAPTAPLAICRAAMAEVGLASPPDEKPPPRAADGRLQLGRRAGAGPG
jgi:hypothetical protein